MGRKVKKCPKKCVKHLFCLKPVHYSAYFSREMELAFCPTARQGEMLIPRFNKDKRYYTPSFTLPIDSKKLQENDSLHKGQHQKFKHQHGILKSEMLIPKPRSKYVYCNVCKCDYHDYLEHIQSQSHSIKIQSNRFNPLIEEMCEELQDKAKDDFTKNLESRYYPETQMNTPSIESSKIFMDERDTIRIFESNARNIECKPLNQQIHSTKSFQLFDDHQDPKDEAKFIVPKLADRNECNSFFFQNICQSPLKSGQQELFESPFRPKIDKPIILNSNLLININL